MPHPCHASLPVSLSLSLPPSTSLLTPPGTCNCPFCAPFFQSTPDPNSLDSPLPPFTSAKYLGSFITPTPPPPTRMSTSGVCRHRPPSSPSTLSSVIPSSHNVSNSAFVLKLFNPSYSMDLNLRLIPQRKSPKFMVSITKHLSNSFTSKTHITVRFFPPLTFLVPMNTYSLSLSLILTLSLSLSLALSPYLVLPSCIPSSMRISDSRIKYLGHILRPDSPEMSRISYYVQSISILRPSFTLCAISPFRRGTSRAHWP